MYACLSPFDKKAAEDIANFAPGGLRSVVPMKYSTALTVLFGGRYTGSEEYEIAWSIELELV